MEISPIVRAAAALITQDGAILGACRKYGAYAGFWEFPGGKVEAGETYEEALHREVDEELGITVQNLQHYYTVDYDYPDFHLHMECYLCELADASAPLHLTVHDQYRWLTPQRFQEVSWLPADTELLVKLSTQVSLGTSFSSK